MIQRTMIAFEEPATDGAWVLLTIPNQAWRRMAPHRAFALATLALHLHLKVGLEQALRNVIVVIGCLQRGVAVRVWDKVQRPWESTQCWWRAKVYYLI